MNLQAELVVAAEAELGEGPVWDEANNRLLWVDILKGHVHATTPDGNDRIIWRAPDTVGCIAPMADGRWLVAERDRLVAVTDWSTREELVRLPIDEDVRTNDGKLDPAGRMLVGTMAFDAEPNRGQLFSWDGEQLRILLEPVTISNGLGWSLDSQTMYYIDTPTQQVDAYDYDIGTGAIANRRTLINVDPSDGSPDGMCVDEHGDLWVALWGGRAVRHYTNAGTDQGTVAIDASNVSCCTWSNQRLWITTARIDSDQSLGDGGIWVVS